MAATTQTALDLIVGALRNLNALEAGEVPNANDANDALQVLNDMLESWSVEKLFVFSSTENILSFTPGVYQYTIGNPVMGSFTGTVTGGTNTITGVTIPSALVVGGTLTDLGGAFPPGTTITASDGVSVITASNNALVTPAVNPDTFTFTVPGSLPIARPVRITNAFTRITVSGGNPMIQGLDYQIRIVPRDKYVALGLKGISGPWPTDLYYDPTFPYGNIYVYPNPSMAGQLHLWTDTLLADFQTVAQAVSLPQGYARAIKTNLALELAAEYGKAVSPSLDRRAREAKKMIQSLNSLEAVEAFFDQHILKSRRADAGWILHGGFYT